MRNAVILRRKTIQRAIKARGNDEVIFTRILCDSPRAPLAKGVEIRKEENKGLGESRQ